MIVEPLRIKRAIKAVQDGESFLAGARYALTDQFGNLNLEDQQHLNALETEVRRNMNAQVSG